MSITNPNGDPELTALTLLAHAMGGGTPSDFITDQEARGQREIVASSVLPTKIDPDRGEWEALGFVFGDKVTGDDLFTNVTLPPGWRREGSDHAMWSYIVDEHGRRRVRVFYKAAFYDRRANASLETVYGYLSECLYGHVDPVLDEKWATRPVVLEELGKIVASEEKDAAKWESWKPDSEYIAEHRERAAAARAMAERINAR